MIVSINWLKKYADIDLPVAELAKLIGSRLVEVERVVDLGARYQGIVVADIKSAEKHPDADKLNIYQADDGGVTPGVPRLDNGYVQVVSGDRSIRTGDKVAWLTPGSTVPASFGESEPFVLGSREMRGQISHGMFGSGKELGLNGDDSSVMKLDTEARAGTPLVSAYELDDYLLDIENKSLTHRPDCFGIIGFAREVAAIAGNIFTTPEWLLALEPQLAELGSGLLDVEASVRDDAACPRYQLVALRGVDNTKQSPIVIQSYLQRVGIRPISAVVDITNYLMYVTGQPLHAFDYDKVAASHPHGKAEIVVRLSRQGEQLGLLDGRTITLSDEDIVICAGDKPIALAGAMGGNSTEIDDSTSNVLLESATFDLYRLRTTQMRHGIFSEAITRYTKGQPIELTAPVLASAVRMLCDVTGGERASEIIDIHPPTKKLSPIPVSLRHLNGVLGTDLDVESVTEVLGRVEIPADLRGGDELSVKVPYWRADLHIAEDIIEEIGRLRGFDTIDLKLPLRTIAATDLSAYDKLRHKVRHTLARAGANEVLTYSFVPGRLLQNAGQKPEDSYRIVNALSPDLQYYRQSLTPSLLSKVHANVRAGYKEFALFELNKVHTKLQAMDGDVPGESGMLALTYVGSDKAVRECGAPFYQAKRLLEYMSEELGMKLAYKKMDNGVSLPLTAPFDPGRSAAIHDMRDGELIGIIGEYREEVQRAMKLPGYTAGFEVSTAALEAADRPGVRYVPDSRYPGTVRDMTIEVACDVPFSEVYEAIYSRLSDSPLDGSLEPRDIYAPEQAAKKRLTIRIALAARDHTVTSDEANELIDSIGSRLVKDFSAAII